MASLDADPPPSSSASWVPCARSCYQTLQWPIAQARAARHVRGRAPAALPPVPQPAHRLLALCDESGLRNLVDRHMRRLKNTPLFARAGPCFDCVVERVADYVVEACGGPLYYSEHHARLHAGAGLPLLLDEEGRELWLVQLWHAFDDVELPGPLRADFWRWAEPLSVHLLSPAARFHAPRRYPYETVRSWFTAAPIAEPSGPAAD